MGSRRECARPLASGGAAVGVAATVTMDVAMVAAARVAPGAFASEKNSPEAIGRWAAGLCRGRWRYEDMSAEPPVRGELWLGLAAHYLTGITLTEVYLAAAAAKRAAAGRRRRHRLRDRDRRPAAPPHVSVHGYGCCGRRSGDVRRLVGSMLLGHAAFGAGIGLWAAATRPRG